MKTTDIQKLVKHEDYKTAYNPATKLSIHVPNPFDMQSTIVINHMGHFRMWESKWLSSEFGNQFVIESESKFKIVIKSTCEKYQAKSQEFLSTFKTF